MTLTISKKLIMAFLGLTIVLLTATLGLARWSFEQGFLDYVNALEETRLRMLAPRLSQEYISAGNSWSKLTEQQFDELLRDSFPENPEQNNSSVKLPPPDFMRPPADHPPSEHPPVERPQTDHPTGHPSNHPRLGPPTALFDTKGQLLAGILLPPTNIEAISVSIMVDEKAIGELQSAPRHFFNSPQETAFSKQQWITSGLIGITSLILATIVSLLLTRVLLAPIRRMISSISQLSDGDYSIRLDEYRKDELGQLMSDLNKLAHKLSDNQSSRQRWLADISHELRTPITVLTGEIETLKDGIRPLDMQQVHSFDQEVTRLRHLIDDLYELSLSDIGGLHYSFSPVSILECLQTSVDLIRKRANEKGIEIELTDYYDSIVNGDTQRLEQLFVNLLENGLAYTDSPGRINITLSGSDKQVSIKIEDTPPGVNKDDCTKLFDPLYRNETSRSRRTAGAGLGLAICKNIVNAHQGTITANPSKLGGLCIHIKLPFRVET